MPDIVTLPVTATLNSTKLEAALRNLTNKKYEIKLNNGFSGPLKGITGDVQSFDTSLTKATNRVVAFGAAAAVFTVATKAFYAFAQATTSVEDSLTKINVNLGESTDGLKKFSSELFNVARQTGQTFEVASKAAEEFARQGLGAEETIKRTKDALILSRIAAIDTADAVNDLTAAVNSYSKEALSTTDIINKFVALDTKFAVSSADLADGLQRAGAVAADAGVSLDKFLSILTAIKQETGRSGSVIANGLKTIFERTRSPGTIKEFEELGIATKDLKGELLPVDQILENVAKSYDTLSQAQQQQINKSVANIQQINILIAYLKDLNKANSVTAQAYNVVTNAQDNAIQKNIKLNQTLKSQITGIKDSAVQFFAAVGNQDLSGFTKRFLGAFETIRKYLSGDTGDELGKALGDGLLRGITNIITGPLAGGLVVLLTKTFTKVLRTIGSEISSLGGINTLSSQRVAIQERIVTLLAQATQEEAAQISAATTLLAQKEAILRISERIAAVQTSNALADTFIESNALGRGVVNKRLKIGGFADPVASAISREVAAGVPRSSIYLDRDARLVGPTNPQGLLVANTRDEPGGGYQGVNRVLAQGGNPKNIGNVQIPHFARLLTQQELINKRFGIDDPRYDAGTSNTGKAKNALDAALERSAVETAKVTEQAASLASKLKLVNIGFEGFTKTLIKGTTQYTTAIGPQPFSSNISTSGGSATASAAAIAAMQAPVIGGIPGNPYRFGGAAKSTSQFKTASQLRDIFQTRYENQRAAEFDSNAGFNRESFRVSQQSSARTRGFENVSGRFSKGESITTAQRRFLQDELLKQARREAQESLAPGTSAGAVDSFVRQRASDRFGNLTKKAEFDRSNRASADSAEAKLGRQQRNARAAFGLAIIAPLAAGFVEPTFQRAGINTTGGTTGGKVSGVVSGALQGAGLGGIFGPQGAVVGAAIGGVLGGFSKLTKSLAEFNKEIEDSTAAQGKIVDAAQRVRVIDNQLKDARDSDASPQVIARLNQQRAEAVNAAPDANTRIQLSKGFGSPEEQDKFLNDLQDKLVQTTNRGNAQLSVRSASSESIATNVGKGLESFTKYGGSLLAPGAGETARLLKALGAKSLTQEAGDRSGLGESLTRLINDKNIGSIDRKSLIGGLGNNVNGTDEIAKLSKIFEDLGVPVEVTVDNFKQLAVGILDATTSFRNQKKADDERVAKAGFQATRPNAFLNTNFAGEQTFQQFGTSRFPGSGALPNNRLTRDQSFIGSIDKLEGLGAFGSGGFDKAGINKTLVEQSKARIAQQGSLSVAADTIGGLQQFRGIPLRNPNGEFNSKTIESILETMSKSSDEQTKFLGEILKNQIKTTGANTTGLGAGKKIPFFDMGLVEGQKYSSYAGESNPNNSLSIGSRLVTDKVAARSYFDNHSIKPDRFANSIDTDSIKLAQNATIDAINAAAKIAVRTTIQLDGTVKLVSDTLSSESLQALAQELTETIGKKFNADIQAVNAKISALQGKPVPPGQPAPIVSFPGGDDTIQGEPY